MATETGRKHKPNLSECIATFLELSFEEPEKPFRTMRDARDGAMQVVGFTRAQEALRSILSQGQQAPRRLADVRTDAQLKPMEMGKTKLWIPPEYPVQRRR